MTVQSEELRKQNRVGWLMSMPAILLMFVFLILPFLMAFGLSLTNQRLVSPNPTEFVGLENYKRLLGLGILVLEPETNSDGTIVKDDEGNNVFPSVRTYTRDAENYPQYNRMREWFRIPVSQAKEYVILVRDIVFIKALRNTIVFVLVVCPLQAGIALILAMLINQPLKGINVFRTIYFIPVVISMVVVSILWKFIYDGQNGLLNALFSMFSFGSFQPVDWLGNPSTALGSIIVMSVWQGVGFHMVIWLAGLQTIPIDRYEVARIEGASMWQTFRYITWPGLRNTAILVLVVITMQAFTLYPQIQVMTQGGPLDSTQSLVYQAVVKGYEKQDISGGSAISVLLFIIVLSISLFQRYITRERN